MAKANSAAPIRVIEETPAYWRVVFDYPPFNILDATIFGGLQDLLLRMDASQRLRLVVFESAIPDFYLAHFDLTGKTGNITTAVGPSGLPILMDSSCVLQSPRWSVSQRSEAACAAEAVSSSSPVTCVSRRAKIRDSANPKSGWDCIPAAAAPNVAHKSSSAQTTSMAKRRNDTDTSTGHFRTPSWTASSTRSRAGSPPSIGPPSPPRRISSTRSRCRPPTGSSMPSPPLGLR
jgi:hypothetical protein